MFQASTTDELLWLVGLAVLNSFISLYYYLMVMRQMYLFDPREGLARFRPTPVLGAVAGLLLLGVLFIGIYPQPTFDAADEAVAALFEVSATGLVRGP